MSLDANDIRNGLIELSEALVAVLDFVDGHRQQLLDRGYSEHMAEKGAMELHHQMVTTIFNQKDQVRAPAGAASAAGVSHSTAAALIGCHKSWVGQLVKQGQLEATPAGKITIPSIMQFLTNTQKKDLG